MAKNTPEPAAPAPRVPPSSLRDIQTPAPPQPVASSSAPPQPVRRAQPDARTEDQARQDAQTALKRFQTANQSYLRETRLLETEAARLSRIARRSALVVILATLAIAGAADLLSIFDLGWIVSWAIPLLSIPIVRRINAINKATASIHQAREKHEKTLKVLLARLGPALRDPQAPPLRPVVQSVPYRFTSYIRSFIAGTVVTQLLEFVPVLSVLPMYLGQVIRMIISQGKAYRRAHRALLNYESVVATLDEYRFFEVELLVREFERRYEIYERFILERVSRELEVESLAQEAESLNLASDMQDVAFAT